MLQKHRRIFWQFLTLIFVIGITPPQVTIAQTPGAQNRERVDPLTGKINIEIPLRTYPGRAGNSKPISILYTNKPWELSHSYDFTDLGGGSVGIEYPHPVYQPLYTSGWSSSLRLPTFSSNDQLYDEFGSPVDEVPQGSGPNAPYYYVDRLTVTMPDGSTHDLRKNDNLRQYQQPSPLGNYYAVDGSRIYFDIISYPMKLVLPDGSRYEYRQFPDPEMHLIRFIDRNGNTTTFDSNLQQWVDTLGRTISLPPLSSEVVGDRLYTLTGFNGLPVNYTFRFKRLADARTNPLDPLRYPGDRAMGEDFHSPSSALSPSLFNSTYDPAFIQFGEVVASSRDLFNPIVLSEIILPDGESYKFTYNVWGEVDKVIYPAGGYERIHYDGPGIEGGSIFDQVDRFVTDRWESPTGLAGDETRWIYAGGEMTAPDNSRLRHYGFWQPISFGNYGFVDCRSGLPTEDRVYDANGNMVRRSLNEWTKSGPLPGGYTNATRDPRITKEVDIILDTGTGPALARTTLYFYDSKFNVRESREYGFAEINDRNLAETGTVQSIPLGTLVRTTEWTYITDPAYIKLVGLQKSMIVKDALQRTVSFTEMFYDETPLQIYSQNVSNWTDPGSSPRGNLTTLRRWKSSTQSIDTTTKYDMFGNPIEITDGDGHVSQLEWSSTYKYGYQTKITSPIPDLSGANGSASALDTRSTFDFTTGLVTTVTDANNRVTNYEYNHPLERLTKAIRPEGGSTTYQYGDTPGNVFVRSLGTQTVNTNIETYIYFDGFHRPARLFANEGSAWRVTETQYDGLGRVWRTSNPYRSTVLNGPIDTGAVWTSHTFDATGREILTTGPDGGLVHTDYLGNTATVTDQANKVVKSTADHAGNVLQVIEDPNGPTPYVTDYTYDALGRLVKTVQLDTQSGITQQRFFMFDWLGRLIRKKDPEQNANPTLSFFDEVTQNSNWSLVNEYDNNGQLLKLRDARGVVIDYQYDRMGRLIGKTYTLPSGVAATPSVSYFYDGAGVQGGILNSKGQMTKVATSGTVQTIDEIDTEGRVKRTTQNTNGQAYSITYEYDLAGHLVAQTYPSGRIVRNDFDAAGRINQITGQAVGQGTPTIYVSQIDYAPHWGTRSLKLGNNLWESTNYNLNLQKTQRGLGTSATDTSRWKIENSYTKPGIGNNGSLRQQIITLPGATFTQDFVYDNYDRLKEAKENDGTNWKQTFLYDRFGNRRFDANPSATTPAVLGPNPTPSLANNRLPGYGYDDAGNVTSEPGGHTYTYDAEGRLSGVDGVPTYTYDGSGHRVMKLVGTVSTVYVRNIVSQLIAEYSSAAPFFGGTRYVTVDQLDTPRVITDAGGQVKARHDYLPFGEELNSTAVGRTASLDYVSDNLRLKFNARERDSETGLDYFGSRYYSSALGRFISPDPLTASADITDPQTWNRYAYVSNNPLKYEDLGGLIKRRKDGRIDYRPTRGPDFFPMRITVTHEEGRRDRSWEVELGTIQTDKGNEIQVERSLDNDPKTDTNCHGVTFADGEYWIQGDQVPKILTEDGYEKVSTAVVGDVVVYYDVDDKGNETVVHSATVTAVDSNGQVTEVSGVSGTQPSSSTTAPDAAYGPAERGKHREVRVFHSKNRTDEERKAQAERAKTFDKAQARIDRERKRQEERERRRREEEEKKRKKEEEKRKKEEEKKKKPGETG